MFDPDTGADYAARFLKSLYAERGDWSAAAGRLSFADPGAGERLSGALRPDPRGPRRRAAHRRGGRARGGAGGRAGAAAQEPDPALARAEDHHRPAEARDAAARADRVGRRSTPASLAGLTGPAAISGRVS